MFATAPSEVHLDEQIANFSRDPAAADRKHHHSVMTLPLMGEEVSATIEYGGSKQNWAQLALYLMDRGFITEKDKGDATELASVGIQKWLRKYAKDIDIFQISIDVTPNIDEQGFSYVDHLSIDETNADIYMLFGAGNELRQFELDEKLIALEASVPGLGQATYYWLVTSGAKIFDVYSPWMGRHMASNVWWRGNETQEDWLEEIELNSEDFDEEFDVGSMPSPESWDASFPAWVNNIAKVFTQKQIRNLAKTHNDAFVRDVCSALLAIIANKHAAMPDLSGTEYYRAYSGIYLYWGGDNDISKRLMDDYMEDVNMTGDAFSECLGLIKIPYENEEIEKLFKELEAGMKQMKNLERLISLVGAQLT